MEALILLHQLRLLFPKTKVKNHNWLVCPDIFTSCIFSPFNDTKMKCPFPDLAMFYWRKPHFFFLLFTYFCFAVFGSLKTFPGVLQVRAPWMRWLCKPGADGDDPHDPQRTQEHCSRRFVWQEGDEVSELEVRRRNTKANQKEREREKEKWKQGDDDMLGGIVASGGVLTDWKWHVVVSAAAIHSCAHHRLLHHHRRQTTTTSNSQKKCKKKKKMRKTSQLVWAVGTAESQSAVVRIRPKDTTWQIWTFLYTLLSLFLNNPFQSAVKLN